MTLAARLTSPVLRQFDRIERWFERTILGRVIGGFAFALFSLELFFLFGIFQ